MWKRDPQMSIYMNTQKTTVAEGGEVAEHLEQFLSSMRSDPSKLAYKASADTFSGWGCGTRGLVQCGLRSGSRPVRSPTSEGRNRAKSERWSTASCLGSFALSRKLPESGARSLGWRLSDRHSPHRRMGRYPGRKRQVLHLVCTGQNNRGRHSLRRSSL